jgi:hypothetical protein
MKTAKQRAQQQKSKKQGRSLSNPPFDHAMCWQLTPCSKKADPTYARTNARAARARKRNKGRNKAGRSESEPINDNSVSLCSADLH